LPSTVAGNQNQDLQDTKQVHVARHYVVGWWWKRWKWWW